MQKISSRKLYKKNITRKALVYSILFLCLISYLIGVDSQLLFLAVVAYFFSMLGIIYVGNKNLESLVKKRYFSDEDKEFTFTVEKKYKELICLIQYEMKTKLSDISSYDYFAQLYKDTQLIAEGHYVISNVSKENFSISLALYSKDSHELFCIDNLLPGSYRIQSNRNKAPENISIREEIVLYD